ncbi:MAG: hypothetical protein ACN4E6_09020 [Qipengyuania pacifica]
MIDVVHLLDDFAFGGVTRALTVFDRPELTEHARSRTVAIGKDRLAERYDADLLVTHVPPSWARLGFLVSLRMRNRDARLVHVEHSYTEGFVRENVKAPHRFVTLLRPRFFAVRRDYLRLARATRLVCERHRHPERQAARHPPVVRARGAVRAADSAAGSRAPFAPCGLRPFRQREELHGID